MPDASDMLSSFAMRVPLARVHALEMYQNSEPANPGCLRLCTASTRTVSVPIVQVLLGPSTFFLLVPRDRLVD